jgi:hypothetical protein
MSLGRCVMVALTVRAGAGFVNGGMSSFGDETMKGSASTRDSIPYRANSFAHIDQNGLHRSGGAFNDPVTATDGVSLGPSTKSPSI